MFIRFDVIHERDGQTYGRTLHDSIDRACIASRGKNRAVGMLKLTTDKHETARGLSATAELLVLIVHRSAGTVARSTPSCHTSRTFARIHWRISLEPNEPPRTHSAVGLSCLGLQFFAPRWLPLFGPS